MFKFSFILAAFLFSTSIKAQYPYYSKGRIDSVLKYVRSITEFDPQEAINQSYKVYENALSAHDTLRMGQALTLHGEALQMINLFDSSQTILLHSIDLMQKNYPCEYAHTLTALAQVKRKLGLFDDALDLLFTSSELFSICYNPSELLNNLYLISLCYDRKEDYSNAILALKVMSSLSKALNDYVFLFRSYNTAFMIFVKSGKNPEPFIDNMLEAAVKSKDPAMELTAWNNLASYYTKANNDSAAEFCYLKAYKKALELGNPQTSAIIAISLSAFYNRLGNWDKAEPYFLFAKDRAQFITEDNWKSLYLFFESKFYIHHQKFDLAQQSLEQSMRIVEKYNNYPLLLDMYEQSSKFFADQKNYQQAYFFLKKHTDVQKILKNNEGESEINRLYYTVLLDLEKEKAKTIILRNENLEKQHNIFVLTIIMSVALLLIISMLFYFFSSKFRKRILRVEEQRESLLAARLRLSKELSERNKEIAAVVLNQVMQNEQSKEVIHQLRKIGEKCTRETQKELFELAGVLGSSQNTKIWNEFERYFKQLNPEFFSRLSVKHENLTSRDLRYCALISLQLSSKELSIITGMTLQSIHVLRSRLRQKLELEKDDDLAVYLASFSQDSD